tara:strand:+ start:338 stop:538 length:201 start_codon:yes stop_codon:yes gene_type:complete
MCIPNRLSSKDPNVTLCESSVKAICSKSPRFMNMGNLASPKVLASLHDDEIKLTIKICEWWILGKE